MEIKFPELLVLFLVDQYTTEEQELPSWRILLAVVNEWIEENKPSNTYITPYSQLRSLQDSVELLREAGLVEKEGSPEATDSGVKLLKQLDQEWKYWPLVLPIERGKPLFKDARYREKRT